MNKNDFDKKLSEKFSEEKYEVLYYGNNSHDNTIIKCLSCNKVITVNTGELFRKKRKKICSKCNYIRKDTIKNREKVYNMIKNLGYNIEFFMVKQSQNGNRGDKVRFTCNNCNGLNEFFIGNVIQAGNCSCQRCSGQKIYKDNEIFQKEIYEKYGKKFQLLSQYVNINTKIKVRCNDCGFIRETKPTSLLKSGYCPKCGKNKSYGEKIIQDWLDSHNINYETQKYFKDWNIGIHYFDFYLPDFNLIIEYKGKQHYIYNTYFFSNIDDFNYSKNKDNVKKESVIKNGVNYLSIKYNLYDHLTEILNKVIGSTTIPNGSRGKCLEMEAFHMEEDIVWS